MDFKSACLQRNGGQKHREHSLGSAAKRALAPLLAAVCEPASHKWWKSRFVSADIRCGLHLGCGSGEDIRLLASLLDENTTLLGIDTDAVLIETAIKKKTRNDLQRIHFTQASLPDLSGNFYGFIFTRIHPAIFSGSTNTPEEIVDRLETGGVLLLEILSLSGFRAYPYNHAYARAMDLIGQVEHPKCSDPAYWRKCLQDAGFVSIETAYAPPVFIPRSGYRIASLTLEWSRETLLHNELSTREELNALLQELRLYELQEDTLICRPSLVQVSAIKKSSNL